MAAVAIAFAVGILAADWIGWSGCLLVVLCVATLSLVFAPTRLRALVVLLCVVLLAGATRYSSDRSIPGDDISLVARHVSAFEGRVASDVTSGAGSIRLTFRVTRARFAEEWRKVSGDVMLNVYANKGSAMPHLAFGDRARILVRPYLPSEPTNPGQFSWKSYLARHGIYACASVRDASQVEVIERHRGRNLTGLALAAKRALVSSIHRVHPKNEASVMSGVVLGSYAYIDEQTLTDFTRTGTLHFLAASGYNCFVLVMLATPVLMLLRVPAAHRSIITIALIAFYLLMVGPMLSLVRAAVMSALALLGSPLRRVADYVNLLYVAALVVLVLSPSSLFDVGFQLSFLAVGALVYVAPLVRAIIHHYSAANAQTSRGWNRRASGIASAIRVGCGWLKGILASAAVATVAVGLVTGPVIAYYFNYVSLTALPANLVVSLTIPIVFLDSFASPLTSQLPYASHYAGFLGTGATRVMLWTVNYFGGMKHSSISVQAPGVLAILGYYLLLYAAGGYVRSKLGKG